MCQNNYLKLWQWMESLFTAVSSRTTGDETADWLISVAFRCRFSTKGNSEDTIDEVVARSWLVWKLPELISELRLFNWECLWVSIMTVA